MRVRGTEFNVVVLNETARETVAMVHGIFSNLSVFYMSIAQELSRRYRVVLHDMRGHGMSETTATGYDPGTMSDDLLAILSALGVRKAHVAGYSYGGLVALHTALHHPETVDKLIVIESPDLSDGQSRPLLERYDYDCLESYLQGCFPAVPNPSRRRRLDKAHAQVRHLFEHTSLKEDLCRNPELFAQIAEHPLPHETLLLYARRTDCANAAEFLRRHLSRSSLHYGEGDHNIPVQNPRWITERITQFL